MNTWIPLSQAFMDIAGSTVQCFSLAESNPYPCKEGSLPTRVYYSGWWFGTFVWPFSETPHCLIFFRGVGIPLTRFSRIPGSTKREQVPASIFEAFGKGSVAFSDGMFFSKRDKGEVTILHFHRISDPKPLGIIDLNQLLPFSSSELRLQQISLSGK